MTLAQRVEEWTMRPNHIELLVDEPAPGHFYWVLVKASELDGRPQPIDYATGPMPSHSKAMMEGIAALQRRTEAKRDAARSPDQLH